MQVKTHNSTHKMERVAGILFLLSLLMPTFNWAFILSKFTSSGSDISFNILNNELLFRLNILIGIFSSIVILALNICLYRILCTVHRSLALGAFSLKLTEAILAAILFLGQFIALHVIKGDPQSLDAHKIVNHLVENYITFTSISGVFFGMSMLIYSFLMFKSGYVHFLVAFSGIVSYSLVVIYDSLVILFPCYAGVLSIQLIGSAPVCLFQIVLGLWLLFKGINLKSTH